MIKLLVSDLDGTLLNSKQELSSFNAKAIWQAQEKGVEFMVASGRSYELIIPFLEKYNLQCGCILLNGAEVRNKSGEIVSTINIDNKNVARLHSMLVQWGYVPFYTTSRGVFYDADKGSFEHAIGQRHICLTQNKKMRETEAIREGLKSTYAKNAHRIENVEEWLVYEKEIRKIVVFDTDTEKNKNTINELTKMFNDLVFVSSFSENIEVNSILAQKGEGLKKAIEVMNIKQDEVAVFGDAANDMSMFRLFKNSYAVDNATPELKQCAKEIIDTNENDGVGKKIIQLLNEIYD